MNKMKLKILTIEGTEKGTMEMPEQFSEPARKDLVKRAVLAIQARNRTPYGAFPEAGKRYSAHVSKRRRDYKGTYGIGQSRTPRKVLSRNGTRFNFVGAFAPQTVGGRQSHPPKASKIWATKINELENRKAIRSALASTMVVELVKARGHKVPASYPFILAEEFNNVKKTAELRKSLLKLGFKDELERSSVVKVRAGKGKVRGRKYKTRKGILFVLSKESDLSKSARNIAGSDIVLVKNINVELLAPGTEPGRLTLFTESAVKELSESKLFTKNYQGKSETAEDKKSKSSKSDETKKPAKAASAKPKVAKSAAETDAKPKKAPAKKEAKQ
jgi:large subunit ribosomal protein L4e